MKYKRETTAFYVRQVTLTNKFSNAEAVVGALRSIARSFGGDVTGYLDCDDQILKVPWKSLGGILPDDDVSTHEFVFSTTPRLRVLATWTPPGFLGKCELDLGLAMPEGCDWDTAERVLFLVLRESGAFWAELNELRVTKVPSFCLTSGHSHGIPHLGTANYFGPTYVRQLGGLKRLKDAGFANVVPLGNGVYVRMPRLADVNAFETYRVRLESRLGASSGIFDPGPPPLGSEGEAWRVAD